MLRINTTNLTKASQNPSLNKLIKLGRKSYLTYPRINFYGQFTAKVSTINNENTESGSNFAEAGSNSWQEFKEKRELQDFSFNPWGDGSWGFTNCKISSVYDKNNKLISNDSLIGLSINGEGNNQILGKIVDLDPQAQMHSTIFGFHVDINGKNLNEPNVLSSKFNPTSFQNIWYNRSPYSGDSCMSAIYHSVLTSIHTNNNIESQVFDQIISATNNNQLSIKFTVDGYQTDSSNPSFTYGNVVGIIAPYQKNYPTTFDYCRFIEPLYNFQKGYVRAKLINNKLLVDYANLLEKTPTPFTNYNPDHKDCDYWTFKNKGSVVLSVVDKLTNITHDFTLTTRDYVDNFIEFFTQKGCIQTFNDLSQDQINAINNNPFVCKINDEIVATENNYGLYVQADKIVGRLVADGQDSINIYGLEYGKPVKNGVITVYPSEIKVTNDGSNSDLYTGLKCKQNLFINNDDKNAVNVKINEENPVAKIKIKAPSTIRQNGDDPTSVPRYAYNLDSIVYQIAYSLTVGNGTYKVLNINGKMEEVQPNILILAFDKYDIPQIPTWVDDVKPILSWYNNVYPVMQNILDLSSYASVTRNISGMKRVFSADINSTYYMPVTRDLNEKKRLMMLKWLSCPIYSKHFVPSDFVIPPNVDDLRLMLQQAIQLEHATIPVYLSALYSIRPSVLLDNSNKNLGIQQIYSLLKSIVIEEMKHMCLSSNILNAIGGQVNLTNNPDILPKYSPKYDGKLPGNVAPQLTISLGPLTKERLKDIYCPIELPSETIMKYIIAPLIEHYKKQNLLFANNKSSNSKDKNRLILTIPNINKMKKNPKLMNQFKTLNSKNEFTNTIGEFYHTIREGIWQLNQKNNLFQNVNMDLQITNDQFPEVFPVHNLDSALNAINTIVEEGEGSSLTDIYNDNQNLSHFHKFLEMFLEKKILTINEISLEKIEKNVANHINNLYANTYNTNIDNPDTFKHFEYVFDGDLKWDENNDIYNNNDNSWTNGLNLSNIKVKEFNESYVNLLLFLNDIFNGKKHKINDAVAIMKRMRIIFEQSINPQPITSGSGQVVNPPIAPTFDCYSILYPK